MTAASETAGVNNPGITPSVARNYGAADLPESRPRLGTSSDLELERAFTDPMANESTGPELGLESITPLTIAMGLTNMLWENIKDLTTSVDRVWKTLDRVENEIKDREIELQTLGTTIHAKKDAKLRAMRRAAQRRGRKSQTKLFVLRIPFRMSRSPSNKKLYAWTTSVRKLNLEISTLRVSERPSAKGKRH